MAAKTSDRLLASNSLQLMSSGLVCAVRIPVQSQMCATGWGEVLAGPIPGRVLRNEADCCQVPGTCRAQVTPHAGDLLDALTSP